MSWVPPNEARRVIEALRTGAIVVFEGPRSALVKLRKGRRNPD